MDTKASIKQGQVWETISYGHATKKQVADSLIRVVQNNGGLIMVENILTGHGSLFGWKTFLDLYTPSVVLG